MVFDEHGFVAFTAYAGRQAYETWLLPSQHAADFDALADDELVWLARMLRRLLAGIEIIGQSLAYNMILHTSPFDRIAGDRYHWHFELVPRDAQFAGFELGSEEFINSVAPERAAATLRKVVD
jgi:UDPglucose--hexose-1-phosphate uridylyltransferase